MILVVLTRNVHLVPATMDPALVGFRNGVYKFIGLLNIYIDAIRNNNTFLYYEFQKVQLDLPVLHLLK